MAHRPIHRYHRRQEPDALTRPSGSERGAPGNRRSYRDYLTPATCEAAMREVGFDDFQWVDAMLDPVERNNPFWNDFMAHAPFTAFRATKA